MSERGGGKVIAMCPTSYCRQWHCHWQIGEREEIHGYLAPELSHGPSEALWNGTSLNACNPTLWGSLSTFYRGTEPQEEEIVWTKSNGRVWFQTHFSIISIRFIAQHCLLKKKSRNQEESPFEGMSGWVTVSLRRRKTVWNAGNAWKRPGLEVQSPGLHPRQV